MCVCVYIQAGPAAAALVTSSVTSSSLLRHHEPHVPFVRNSTFIDARRHHRHKLKRQQHRQATDMETALRRVDFSHQIHTSRITQLPPPPASRHHLVFPSIQFPVQPGNHRETRRNSVVIQDQQIAKRFRLNGLSTNLTAAFKTHDTPKQVPGEDRLLPIDEPSSSRWVVEHTENRSKTVQPLAATSNGIKSKRLSQIMLGKENGNDEYELELTSGSARSRSPSDGYLRSQRQNEELVSKPTLYSVQHLHGGNESHLKNVRQESNNKLLALTRAATITGNNMAAFKLSTVAENCVVTSQETPSETHKNEAPTIESCRDGIPYKRLHSKNVDVRSSSNARLELMTDSEQFKATSVGEGENFDKTFTI